MKLISDRWDRRLDRIGVGLIGLALAFGGGWLLMETTFSAVCRVEGAHAGLRVEYRREGGCLALIDGYGWAPFATVVKLTARADR